MFKVVGITSCSCGIAHTYMNAEALVKKGKEYGMSVHIEKQGQLGIEDEISDEEFAEADAIVLCCGLPPLNPERFENYEDKIVEIDFNKTLQNPNIFIDALNKAGFDFNK